LDFLPDQPKINGKKKGREAYLGDVAKEDFGGSFDALEADDDARAPARLRELHAGGVDPHAGAAHVRRAPLVRTRVALDGAARQTGEFHRVAREGDPCDARVQRGEEERLEQRGFACVRVELRRRGVLLTRLNEPRREERGEEVVSQDVDVADRRGGDVVLVVSRRSGSDVRDEMNEG
jgi:hypothetical protein